MIYLTIGVLYLAVPVIALARALRLISAQRFEFEQYHRQWVRHFWLGFFEKRKERPA